MLLTALDEIIESSGVESIGPISLRDGPPFQYLNMGDAYVITLIYSRDNDELRLGCWGDVVERHPELREDG